MSEAVLENKYENMAEQLKEVKQSLRELWTSLAVNQKIIMDKFDSLDTKYATKTSVNRIWIIIWSIIGFFASAAWALIVRELLLR